jgi:hypothetical protein
MVEMRAPDTVTEALQLLQEDGYVDDFEQAGAQMTCPVCSAANRIERGVVERIFRFEGPSDPGDEAIVLGVRCANCGARGTLVSAFGPDADPDVFARLVNLVTPPGADSPT